MTRELCLFTVGFNGQAIELRTRRFLTDEVCRIVLTQSDVYAISLLEGGDPGIGFTHLYTLQISTDKYHGVTQALEYLQDLLDMKLKGSGGDIGLTLSIGSGARDRARVLADSLSERLKLHSRSAHMIEIAEQDGISNVLHEVLRQHGLTKVLIGDEALGETHMVYRVE